MKKNTAAIALGLFVLSLAFAPSAFAGGALETVDITAGTPSPIPGHILARVIGIKWDSRSFPVPYLMNNTLDPIPNPLGAPFLTLAQATAATQTSLNAWNSIPTSFVNLQLTGQVANLGLRGFDFKNEVTFRTAAAFGAIASSPSTNLIEDGTFAHGDDIDGDGDSDVSNAITVMSDADADGDHEFPPGFYKAGTILDNDVQFNTKVSNGFRFTTNPADADTTTRSVDYFCVAVHEFGHSFGLSHVLDNQISDTDGTGSTMFPFIDTGDPASELSQATPAADDIAFASYFYQEGSAASGPGAIQAGDVRFDSVYGLIRGEARHGVQNRGLAGASVTGISHDPERLVSAFSGTTQLSFNPATGGLFFLPNPDDGILNGDYVLPVPAGVYTVGIEAVDGNPVPAANISFTTQIGNFYGQMNFHEEFFDRKESDVEKRLGDFDIVQVSRGATRSGVNIVTNRTTDIRKFGNRNFVGFTASPGGRLYAVQVAPGDMDLGLTPLIHAIVFDTFVVDASVVPVYAQATLAKGTVSAGSPVTATIDLATPIAIATGFVGQDDDFAPFHFANPKDLGASVRERIATGEIENLFLVLQLPPGPPFAGVSNQAPLIGLDGGVATNDVPIAGRSFLSNNGGATWIQRTDFNFRFGLVVGTDPNQ